MPFLILVLALWIPLMAEPRMTARSVKLLSSHEIQTGRPLELEAVVTLFDPALYLLIVQDQTDAIYVEWKGESIELRAGMRVRITGVTGAGMFAPIVRARRIDILGQGIMPVSDQATVAALRDGKHDNRFGSDRQTTDPNYCSDRSRDGR